MQNARQELDTPPDSPLEQSMEEPTSSRRALANERQRRRARKKHSREIQAMKEKIEKLRKERNRLRKHKWRQNKAQMTSKSSVKQKRSKTTVDSPRTETEKMVSGSRLQNPNIKRALLFHNVLSQELRMNNETPVSRRRADDKSCHGKLALSGKVLRKYRLLHSVRQFGVSYKSMSERQTTEKKKTYLQRISQTVQEFFVCSSRMTTDKTDTITRKKIKQQRMILTDSMLNLHIDFLQKNQNLKLSYSSFCTLRPFYVTAPKASDRSTCLCHYHANANLMLQALKSSDVDVVQSTKLEDSFQLVCCSPASEACLLRTCLRCRTKQTVLAPELAGLNVEWMQWERVQDQTASGSHFNMRLNEHSGSLSELLHLYQEKLKSETTTHVCLVRNQASAYRDTVKTCSENTVIVHIDFSESWKCKNASEVQACHYGQNLPQLTLHTGMYYTKGEKAAFCSVSESRRQDAAAIWTHMDPVLKNIRTKYPSATTVHFWSDGPSKQYKNKKNFFLLSEVPPTLGFNRTTWNYFPTAHGKGAPDGIGGTVKRTADSLILQGNHIVNGNVFFEKVSNRLTGVQLYHIKEESMETYDAFLMQNLRQVPSTRQVHQDIPNQNGIGHRQLSCFCSEPLNCLCFAPATSCLQGCLELQHTEARTRKKRPLTMLMEEMENEVGEEEDTMEEEVEEAEDGDLMEDEETFRSPDGTVVDITINNIDKGDWLAVIYDDHWWLAKCLQIDREHQDLKVEFMHPCGPTANFHPKHGRRDVCFCPLKDILMKLTGSASPLQSSRTRELYSITPDVMDFIEHKHVHRLLPNV